MEINRKNAIKLWDKIYGKAKNATNDFSGREIHKGAYDNKNSKYCWNIDHILPLSKGGTDNESNLIITHINTNSEKANKFPTFSANNKNFEILKVDNHYEIFEKQEKQEKQEKLIDFFDHNAANNFFFSLQENKKQIWYSSVLIRVKNVKDVSIYDFIKEMFKDFNVGVIFKFIDYRETCILIPNIDADKKNKIQNILNRCILLNTYLGSFFKGLNYITSKSIFIRTHSFKDSNDFYQNYNKSVFYNFESYYDDCLYIDELTLINTDAKEKKENPRYDSNGFIEHDFVYTNLDNNIKNQIKKWGKI